MTLPKTISIDVKHDSEGFIDTAYIIRQIEAALENRVIFTDWVDESKIAEDFPHLSEEGRIAALTAIDVGNYDEAIDRDVANGVIADAVDGIDMDDESSDAMTV